MNTKTFIPILIALFFFPIIPALSVDASSSTGGYVDVFERSETDSSYIIRGWAYNPTAPDSDVEVDIYVNGVRVALVEPTSYRSDVAAYLGVERSFGFEYELPTSAFTCGLFGCEEVDEVQMTARDVETKKQHMLIGGIQEIEHDAIGLTGAIDRISEENEQDPELFVRGWVTSTQYPGSDYDIYVMTEGQLVGMSDGDAIARTDVADAYDLSSSYVGYAVSIDTSLISSESGASFFVFAYDNNSNRFERIGEMWYEF